MIPPLSDGHCGLVPASFTSFAHFASAAQEGLHPARDGMNLLQPDENVAAP